MISEFKQITELFQELDKEVRKTKIFLIGGAMLLYHGIKPATKDVDLIVEAKEEFTDMGKALKKIGFVSKIP